MTEQIELELEVSAIGEPKPKLCALSYVYSDGRNEWLSCHTFVGSTAADVGATIERIERNLHPDCEITKVLLTVVDDDTLEQLGRARAWL